jgi:hypothetical protein
MYFVNFPDSVLIYHTFFKQNIVAFRTDTFSVRTSGGGGNVANPPSICGVNTGEHSKFHVSVITST